MDKAAALDVRFDTYDGDNITVRDYFMQLLLTLWDEGESFSGKRPFGNSGWQFELYAPLIADGFLTGELDESGHVNKYNEKEADEFIKWLIFYIFKGKN